MLQLHFVKRWAKQISKLGLGAIGLLAFSLLVSQAITAPVQAEEETAGPETISLGLPDNFDYTARRSNNLTLLVRRAIQIYDDSDTEVNLSKAQIIYAETNIVRELGAYPIDVGQAVSVPTELVAKYFASAQELNQSQLTAWGRYAGRATFDLSDIQPTNITEEKPADEQAAGEQQDQAPAKEETAAPTGNSDDNNWWWFALLAIVILGAWYTRNARREISSPPPRTKRRPRR